MIHRCRPSRVVVIPVPTQPKQKRLPEPVCEDAPRPRYTPGTYDVYCVKATQYLDTQYRAHKAVLHFHILGTNDPVQMFLHLGSSDKGQQPKAGPRSKYRRAWVIANGAAPQRRQVMSLRVFAGKYFRVEIQDVIKRHDQQSQAPADVYSVVGKLLERIDSNESR